METNAIRRPRILPFVLALGAAGPATAAPAFTQAAPPGACQPEWLPKFGLNGVDGTILAAVLFDDGSGGGEQLYVGGDFDLAGTVAASNVARWDGARWWALGDGIDGIVRALAVYDDGSGPALHVGGEFTSAGGVPAANLARWQGGTWSALGVGTDGPVRCLAAYAQPPGSAGDLYVGGAFTSAGGQPTPFLARWNAGGWAAQPATFDGPVNALASTEVLHHGLRLVVGGEFTTIGGMFARHIAWMQAGNWGPFHDGTDGPVHAIVSYEPFPGFRELFVGGEFQTAGGHPSPNLARWVAPGLWDTLYVQSPNGPVRALGVHAPLGPTLVYVGGDFTHIGGVSSPHLVIFNGFDWVVPQDKPTAPVHAMVTREPGSGGIDPGLYVCGQFQATQDDSPYHDATRGIAHFAGHDLRVLGNEVHTVVTALGVHDDGSGAGPQIYASGARFPFDRGRFGNVDSAIARWDGERWSPLGSGLNWEATSLVTHDDGSGPALYAGGWFTSAGGSLASHIARWDGSSWSSVGAGFTGTVYALASYDSGNGSGPLLYAGLPGSGLRVWTGSTWGTTSLNSGAVRSLLVRQDVPGGPAMLYVGGDFHMIGLQVCNSVALWTGTAWSPLGLGIAGECLALAYHDDGSGSGPAIYVAGNFDSVWDSSGANHPAKNIARWDGTTWTPLGDGLNWPVTSLVVHDDGTGGGAALYAGGSFTASGSTALSHVARWDGSSWTPLEAGVGGGVLCMLSHDDGEGPALYVGGYFSGPPPGGPDVLVWGGCDGGPGPIGTPYCFGDGSGTACPCANAGGAGEGCAHSGGQGARLSAAGSASVAAADLVLQASGLVPGQPGLYFQGTTRVAGGNGVVYGDGLRCAGGSVLRLQTRMASAAGESNTTTNLVAAGAVSPGITRTYQLWYRDPVSSPCLNGFNLTHGLEITWLP